MTPPALALIALLTLAPAAAPALAAAPGNAAPANAAPANVSSPVTAAAPSLGQYTDTLQFEVIRVAPLVAGAGDHLVTVVARTTNTGPDPIGELAYRFQRGKRIANQAALRAELDDPSQPVAVINSPFKDVNGVIEPGETRAMVFSVPIAGPEDSSLAINRPGVYPVMINVNATVQTAAGDLRARIGEIHLTVSVGALPDSPPATEQPPGVQVLWPLASTPHLAVGDVFRTDKLADEIAPGGRLDRMLDEWEDAGANLATAVIDPMLLDELDRMSRGYRVLKTPNRPQAPLQPTAVEPGPPATSASTEPAGTESAPTGAPDGSETANPPATLSGDGTPAPGTTAETSTAANTATTPADIAPDADTVAGTGQQAAIAFLGRLRALALARDMIVLPYGDADIAALARAGMYHRLTDVVESGRAVAARVLATPAGAPRLITDVALPPGGMITDLAWQHLTELGYTSMILTRRGVKPATAGAVTVTSSKADWPALTTGAPRSADITEILDSATAPSSPDEIRALGAEWLINPATEDIVIVPPRDADPEPGGLAALTRLTGELAAIHLITLRPLTDLIRDAATATGTTLRYPTAARDAELPGDYLSSLADLATDIDTLTSALQPGDTGLDPAEILTSLADTLLPATSASLRDSTAPVDGALTTARDTVSAFFDGVTIQRDNGRYTLASTAAPLLLTIRNTLPYRVVITVDIIRSSQLGLSAVAPDPITIDPGPRSTDIKVDTTVTRSGTFVVDAQLYTANRVPWGSTVPLVVDSRAYGTLTIVLMASAGGILLLMVIWRLVQRLRGGVPEEALVDDEDAR